MKTDHHQNAAEKEFRKLLKKGYDPKLCINEAFRSWNTLNRHQIHLTHSAGPLLVERYTTENQTSTLFIEEGPHKWEKKTYISIERKKEIIVDVEIYHEDSSGYWKKTEFNDSGLKVREEDSNEYLEEWAYDSEGREILHTSASGDGHEYRKETTYTSTSDGGYMEKSACTKGGPFDKGSIFEGHYDKKGKFKYRYKEDSSGYWKKDYFDSKGRVVKSETSNSIK